MDIHGHLCSVADKHSALRALTKKKKKTIILNKKPLFAYPLYIFYNFAS